MGEVGDSGYSGVSGIVCAPHPFDKLRSKRINSAMLDRFVKGIDMIEVIFEVSILDVI